MIRSRPNVGVAYDTTATTQLTYAAQTSPTPLTTSVPGEDPTLGSLEVVITNPTGAAVDVEGITFTMTVGANAASLMQTTTGVLTAVSDTTNWTFPPPQPDITSGTISLTLGPATGTSVPLAAGASVIVQVYGFATIETPANTTIDVKEMIAGSTPAFTSFQVTTFPDGFYFDGLTATVASGSALVPIAQVPNGTNVTLVWNSSVADTSTTTIYYSSATAGQQSATPSTLGEWTTPEGLSADTVFTVVVEAAAGPGGQTISASQSVTVAVQNPALVAESLSVSDTVAIDGAASIGGALTANAIAATGLAVTGSGSASVGGDLSVGGSATMSGTASVQQLLTAAGGANIASALTMSNANVSIMQIQGLMGSGVSITTPTDGFAIAIMAPPADSSVSSGGCVKITCPLGTPTAFGGNINGYSVPGYLCVPIQAGWQVTWSYDFFTTSNRPTAFFFFAALGQRVGQ